MRSAATQAEMYVAYDLAEQKRIEEARRLQYFSGEFQRRPKIVMSTRSIRQISKEVMRSTETFRRRKDMLFLRNIVVASNVFAT